MSIRVLVADDSKSWRYYNTEMIKNLFDKNNILIDSVQSAYEGLNKIEENISEPYDFIITDLQMEDEYEPLTAGEWFIEKIKEKKEYSDVKIIIISAMPTIKFIAEKYGVNYISKSQLINDKKQAAEKLQNIFSKKQAI